MRRLPWHGKHVVNVTYYLTPFSGYKCNQFDRLLGVIEIDFVMWSTNKIQFTKVCKEFLIYTIYSFNIDFRVY